MNRKGKGVASAKHNSQISTNNLGKTILPCHTPLLNTEKYLRQVFPKSLITLDYKKIPLSIPREVLSSIDLTRIDDLELTGDKVTWGSFSRIKSVYHKFQPIDFQRKGIKSYKGKTIGMIIPDNEYLCIDFDVPNKDIDILPILEKMGINTNNTIIERTVNGGYHLFSENTLGIDQEVTLNKEQLNYIIEGWNEGFSELVKEVFGSSITSVSDIKQKFGNDCKFGIEIKSKHVSVYGNFISEDTTLNQSTKTLNDLIKGIDILSKSGEFRGKNTTNKGSSKRPPVSLKMVEKYLQLKGIHYTNENGYISLNCPFHDDNDPSGAFKKFGDVVIYKCFVENKSMSFWTFVKEIEGSTDKTKQAFREIRSSITRDKLKESIKSMKVDYNRTIEYSGKISKKSSDLYHEILSEEDLLIDGPTGGGKTTSIIDLLRYKEDKFILLVPYTSMTSQFYKKFEMDKVDGSVSKCELIPILKKGRPIVSTYDGLKKIMENGDPNEWTIIIDEIHNFILQDSFRDETISFVMNHLEQFKRRIYLSGTIVSPIISGLPNKGKIRKIKFIDKNRTKKNFKIYTYERNTNKRVQKYLIDYCLNNSSNDNLIIIQWNNKKILNELNQILKEYRIQSIITSSDEKDIPEYISITDNEVIPDSVNILLTTSVLNDGINIQNENIHSVITVNEHNLLSIEQFFNRFRRCSSNTKFISINRSKNKCRNFENTMIHQIESIKDEVIEICDHLNPIVETRPEWFNQHPTKYGIDLLNARFPFNDNQNDPFFKLLDTGVYVPNIERIVLTVLDNFYRHLFNNPEIISEYVEELSSTLNFGGIQPIETLTNKDVEEYLDKQVNEISKLEQKHKREREASLKEHLELLTIPKDEQSQVFELDDVLKTLISHKRSNPTFSQDVYREDKSEIERLTDFSKIDGSILRKIYDNYQTTIKTPIKLDFQKKENLDFLFSSKKKVRDFSLKILVIDTYKKLKNRQSIKTPLTPKSSYIALFIRFLDKYVEGNQFINTDKLKSMFSKYLEETNTPHNSIIDKWLPPKTMTFILNSLFKAKRTKKKDEYGHWVNVYELVGTYKLDEVIEDNNLTLKEHQNDDLTFGNWEYQLTQNVV